MIIRNEIRNPLIRIFIKQVKEVMRYINLLIKKKTPSSIFSDRFLTQQE